MLSRRETSVCFPNAISNYCGCYIFYNRQLSLFSNSRLFELKLIAFQQFLNLLKRALSPTKNIAILLTREALKYFPTLRTIAVLFDWLSVNPHSNVFS